jgi:Zn-finger nucleic acid-binding protein
MDGIWFWFMIYKSACPHCDGHIEFESEHLGRATNCPHCAGEILLSTGELQPQIAGAEPQKEPAAWNVFARVFRSLEEKQLDDSAAGTGRANRIEATMRQVRDGTWEVDVNSLVLATGERALWRQAAAAVDPEVIGGPSQNSAYAVTTRIFKSITTRLTQRPSQLRAHKAVADKTSVPGEFIVTTTRLVFSSKSRTFITRYENIEDIVSTLEGIRYFERGKNSAYGIKYAQPNGDIITQIIDHCMNESAQLRG